MRNKLLPFICPILFSWLIKPLKISTMFFAGTFCFLSSAFAETAPQEALEENKQRITQGCKKIAENIADNVKGRQSAEGVAITELERKAFKEVAYASCMMTSKQWIKKFVEFRQSLQPAS